MPNSQRPCAKKKEKFWSLSFPGPSWQSVPSKAMGATKERGLPLEQWGQRAAKLSFSPYWGAEPISLEVCETFFFFLFMATPMAYGSSQARGQVRAAVASLCRATAMLDLSCIFNLCHGNAGSLTHWVRPGIEHTFSQEDESIEPQWECHWWDFLKTDDKIHFFLWGFWRQRTCWFTLC